MPSADFCTGVKEPRGPFSPVTGTRRRPPEVSSTAFPAHPPDLHPRPLMDEDFAVSRPLVRPGLPDIRFLFVGSRFCSTLLSDPASRRRPCASLALHLHQVVQGTCTPKLSNMLGTRLNRSAVGKTAIALPSRWPQRPAPSTRTSLPACPEALRRALLRLESAWGRARPLFFPVAAVEHSPQNTPLAHLFNLLL
jgi:hypothetical protein